MSTVNVNVNVNNSLIQKVHHLYSNIYNPIIWTGILLTLITINNTTPSTLTGNIVGYGFIAGGLLLLLGFLYTIFSNTTSLTGMAYFFSILNLMTPILILVGIVIATIYLLTTNYTKISTNRVSKHYSILHILTSILFIIEMGIFYTGTNQNTYNTSGTLNTLTSVMMYLVETIHILLLIMLGIFLSLFRTDG